MAKTKKRSIFTRLLSAVTAVSSASVMLPAIPELEAAAYDYVGLVIAGVQVTSQNANDVLGDGVFRVSDLGTVYVNGNCTYSGTVIDWTLDDNNFCDEHFDEMATSAYIRLEGDSTLTSLNGDAIVLHGNYSYPELRILGDHSLVLNAKQNCIATEGAQVHVANADLTMNGNYGIHFISDANAVSRWVDAYGDDPSGPYGPYPLAVFFNNTDIHAQTTQGAVVGMEELYLKDCIFKTPDSPVCCADGYYASYFYDDYSPNVYNGTVKNADGTIAKNIEVYQNKTYDLIVSGKLVAEDNCSDILGNGTAVYDPANEVLTLYGDVGGSIIRSQSTLTVYAANDDAACTQLIQAHRTPQWLITGPGTLTTGSISFLSQSDGTCTIRDTNVNVTNGGIHGEPRWTYFEDYWEGISEGYVYEVPDVELVIDHSNLHVQGGIKNLGNIILTDCAITNSDGADVRTFDLQGMVAHNLVEWGDIDETYLNDYSHSSSSGMCAVVRNDQFVNDITIESVNLLYDLEVLGIKVTDFNRKDILGNGVFSYEPSEKTLHIHGNYANSTAAQVFVKNTGIEGLTIQTDTDSAIVTTKGSIFYLDTDTTFTGPGKLTLSILDTNYGTELIVARNSSTITIKDADLECNAGRKFGILASRSTTASLNIIDSSVKVYAEGGALYRYLGGITLEDCVIVSPEGAYIQDGTLYNEDGTTATKFEIKPYHEYDLEVAGTQVTSFNENDILGNGVCAFDPKNNTLTISGNYTINDEDDFFIKNEIDGLIIYVASDSVINVAKYCAVRSSYDDMTITGPGKLTLNGYIYINDAKLTIRDANLDVRSSYGITGSPSNDSLVIINSIIHAEGDHGAVCDFANDIELKNCFITSPEGAKSENGAIRNADGSKAKVVDIMPGAALNITKQPENASGCIGDKVQFTVEAEGNGLVYQWQYYNTSTKKWENTGLAGNKTPTLTVTVTAGRNNMKYHCIVKDNNGTKLVSNAATLKVNPKIVTQPVDASGCIGDKVQFSVEATGVGLIYQWQYYNTSTKKWENTGLTGNKTATLTVTVTAGRNNMKYHCIVKDTNGTKLTSTPAKLIVNPKIVTQPVDASGCIGDKVQFTVEATGVGLVYQWQYYNTSTKKWENTGLTGNQTPTLTVTVNSARNGMKYHCIVKDANGTKLTSSAATLKVNPKIVTQPADASGAIGDKVQFTVEATGAGLIYQWQYYNTSTKKWENTGLAGNQSPTLTVTVTSARSGMKYHCIVKDANGTKLTSTAATLKVLPKIVTQPQSVSATAGSTAKFTVEATGIGLTYQWQYYNTSTKKWENTGLAGNKTATLSVTAIASRNGMKYHCIVKDSAGNKLTSTAATLTVK